MHIVNKSQINIPNCVPNDCDHPIHIAQYRMNIPEILIVYQPIKYIKGDQKTVFWNMFEKMGNTYVTMYILWDMGSLGLM